MKNKALSRRKFLGTLSFPLALGGLFSVLPSRMLASKTLSESLLNSPADISISKGKDVFAATQKALEGLGGISRFVKPGQKVAILVNSPWDEAGSFTNPDVALAVIHECHKAGATEILAYPQSEESYWKRSANWEKTKSIYQKLRFPQGYENREIPNGVNLKKAEIANEFLSADVFINIPVAKHHQGTNFSCNLKNMMGLCPYSTNKYIHSPSGDYTYSNNQFLSQGIADLNLVRKADLCVVDASVCLMSNGPFGPGRIKQLDKVVAGSDPVAVDAYCAELLGHFKEDIIMIDYAAKHGLGNSDYSSLTIKETSTLS